MSKKIVVLGAGFAGLQAAIALEKRLKKNSDIDIIVVDKRDYHVFYPNLYEVAASPEELTDTLELKHSIVVPLSQIGRGKRIKFLKAEVTEVNSIERYVQAGSVRLSYEYLIVALGSTTHFYNIPGAEEKSFTLKSLPDALKIRNRIEFLLQAHRQDISKDFIRIVVAGGGFAGIEQAAELSQYLNFLAWKNNYPRHKLEVVIVEGTTRILPGLDDMVARDVLVRLQDLRVHVQTNRMVSSVDDHFIDFTNGERMEYDCLVWTAGIKASPTYTKTSVTMDRTGRVMTSECLQGSESPYVFYIGDQGCIMDKHQHPLPSTIPQAMHQANYVAKAIVSLLSGKQPVPYECKSFGYFITVGGKWAVFKAPYIYLKGRIAYFIRWCVYVHYFYTILGIWRGLKYSIFEAITFSKNDL